MRPAQRKVGPPGTQPVGGLLPPMPRFGAGAAERYVERRASVLEALAAYVERFLGLG